MHCGRAWSDKGMRILAVLAAVSCTPRRARVPSQPFGGGGVAGLLLPFSCRVVPLRLDTELRAPIPGSHSGTLCLAGPVRVSVIRVGHRRWCGVDVSLT